jgi:hypothetical protein
MKYIIGFLTVLVFASILIGFFTKNEYSQKFIGFGVLGLFLVVIPLFSYYRWKDKDVKDYLITKENIDKMRNKNV